MLIDDTLEYQKAQIEQEINIYNIDIEKLKQQKSTLTTEINSLTKDKNTLVAEIGDVDTDDTLEYNKAELEKEIEDLNSQKSTEEQNFKDFKATKENEKKVLISEQNKVLETHCQDINEKIEVENNKLKLHQETIDKHIKDCDGEFAKRKTEINKETKIIESFHHFIAETNKNMKIYFWSALGIILIAGLVLGFGLYNFCEAFSIYSSNLTIADKDGIKTINSVGGMLANAGGLFILKLPLSLVLITFIAGFYKLLKSMLTTYEKINKDKRNASAVYAIMNTLNEESVAIVRGEEIDWTSQESIDRIREKIKWDKVSEYFSSLQKEQDTSVEKDNNQNTITMSVFMDKVIALAKEFKK